MRTIAVAVLLTLSAFEMLRAGTTIKPTTTLAAETGNNTSTATTYQPDVSGNLGASNISKVDIRTLLYPGATTPIYVHFMGWFGLSNHANVGYTSWDPTQVRRQVDDMLSRGITGAILDWYGQAHWTEDNTAGYLKQEAEARNGQFVFALTEDKGALSTCANTAGCDVTQALINDLTYAYNTYETSPAYLRINGRPAMFFFDVETNYTINWDLVVASVPGNPLFIFRNASGFARPYSAGSYAWIGFTDSISDWGKSYLDKFYNTSVNYATLSTFGSAYKGFNDALASWGKNRLVPQDCGHTWMASLAEIGQYYSSSNQLPFLQLATWNDYEEGTALEMGIDNCVSVAGAITGSTLTWSIVGSEAAIDHYTVFISADAQNLMPVADVPAGTNLLDLSAYAFDPGNYTVYVKAVGKASLKNQMSAAIAYAINITSGGPTTSPAPDFALTAAPASLTIANGTTGTAAISIMPQGGFSSVVTFTCGSLPPNAGCSFAPPTVTPGANSASTTVSIATATRSAARQAPRALYAFFLPVLGMMAAGMTRRRKMLLALAALGVASMLLSCGVAPHQKPATDTPAGDYSVVITATANSLQHTVTVRVSVP